MLEVHNTRDSKGSFYIFATCICILNPLEDKTDINLSFSVKSIVKYKSKGVGRVEVDFIVCENELKNQISKTRIYIEDPKNLITELSLWGPQMTQRIEKKLKEIVTKENLDKMINEIMELRRTVKDIILSEKIIVR